ncbi:uncharacterized protein LOC119746519 isoform X2 [Patiria miniata]|uniref:Ig-like domain-containing protein n=1 Tax=Patiria miniata TaxID=46514 RepID=A0A914BT09_PATMI|nr:uncharacterized protein LOC119746519 isoform X2 [Patiria miniata]
MAVRVCWYGIFVGVLLLVSYPVDGDVTVQVDASTSHPMEGHSTSLSCRVRSMNQSQVIVWSKDRRSITWGDTMGQMMSSRFELDMESRNTSEGMLTSYILTINDVTRDDDGSYECEVLQENDGYGYSAMASKAVHLSVLYFPSSVYPYCSLNGSQTLLTGTELTVTCTSEVGNPQIISEWMTGDDTVPSPMYRNVESSSMMVSELAFTASHDLQGATFVCRVTSEAYPETYRTCSLGPLRIMDWPVVDVTRSLERVTEGADIHFLCSTDPVMPSLNWETIPSIDPERLNVMDGGAILTVKNVQLGDNMTSVICRVPYRDTYVENRSTLILPAKPHVEPTPSLHATSELCVSWFAAFLFTVVISFVLCIIIVRLLMKIKLLTYKLNNSKTVERGRESVRSVDTGTSRSLKKDSVLTWPASLRSSSSNWSMRSDKELKDQRRQSWVYMPPPGDDLSSAMAEPTTYTELSPDPADRTKSYRKPRKTVSLQGIHLSDSDYYVTPNSHSKPMAKSASASPQKNYKKSGKAVIRASPTKTPTSQPGKNSKRGDIGTVSERVPMRQSSVIEMSSYMDLDEQTKDLSPKRQTYQALQKTPNSSRYVSKPLKSSLKKTTEKASSVKKFSADDMMGDSGIYGESGLYMKQGEGDIPSTDSEISKPAQRQNSMMGESASYMPLGTVKSKRATAQSSRNRRSGTLSSESSTDARDTRSGYEVPPDAGTTDDYMGEAVYEKSLDTKDGGKGPARGQSRASLSSSAPMPNPSARGRKGADSTSCESPFSSENGKNPVYFTLEQDNYGADISSESESYQGPETFDRNPTGKPAKSAPARKHSSTSETSYLDLTDADGEIKGYMDMTKAKPKQLKAPSTVTKMPPKAVKVQPKITKQVSLSDSECSSNGYYLPMEGDQRVSEYAVPPSNQLKQLVRESDQKDVIGSMESHAVPRVERKLRKKGGWGRIFKK